MRTTPADPAVKAQALALAELHGPGEAAKQTGVNPSTIRMWQTRARQALSAPVGSGTSTGEVERLRRTAKRARNVMDAAIKRVEELLPTAKNPRDISIAAGILSDKAAQIDAVIAAIEDRQIRLADANGQQIVAVMELAFEAIGVPLSPSVRAVLRELLRQAGAGGPLSVSPAAAEPARADVRAAIASDLQEEERGLERRELQRLSLPAAPPAEPEELEELAPDERGGQEPEVVDAEVVDTEPDQAPVTGRISDRPGHTRGYGDPPFDLRPRLEHALARGPDMSRKRVNAPRPADAVHAGKPVHAAFTHRLVCRAFRACGGVRIPRRGGSS
jgi:hypothetical protein